MDVHIKQDISRLSDTERIGMCLGKLVMPGDVIALLGDLGAGKTTFTKAVAVGAGVVEPVSSPTFSLIREYAGRLPVYHMDVYRLGTDAHLEDLGWEDYFYGDGVCLVEWAEFLSPIFPDDVLYIKFTVTDGQKRVAEAYGTGQRSNRLVKEWQSQCLT